MRIGTIGSGFIVRYILENIAKTDGISCEAVYSRKLETGQKLANEFHVSKVYTDLDEMCQDDSIDMIYIASPNSLHYGHAKKALQYGKHVICEKPFTPTVEEAKELIDLAKEKHVFLFEAITTLYHPHFSWIKEHMDCIGDLKMISSTFCQYSSRYDLLKNGEVTNVFNPDFAGGSLMDINVYNIHFLVGLLGRPDHVEYFAGRHTNGVDTHGILIMTYGDVICQCTGAKDTWCENSVQIMGDKGYMYITPGSNNSQEVRLIRKNMPEEHISLPENQWYYEIQELVKLMDADDYETCYKNLDITLEVVRILEACRVGFDGRPTC